MRCGFQWGNKGTKRFENCSEGRIEDFENVNAQLLGLVEEKNK